MNTSTISSAPVASQPHRTRRIMALGPSMLVALAILGTSCSSDEGGGDPAFATPTSEATAGTDGSAGSSDPDDDPVEPALVDIGVEVSNAMDVHPTGGSLLVAQRHGEVLELVPDGSGGYTIAGTVADLTAAVGNTDGEKGLLGVTTDPEVSRMFLNHTRAGDGATVILEVTLQGQPGALTSGRTRELLVIDQPFVNHNGGDIEWGPDAMLWIGTGDGGGADDPDGRAQRLTDPLGKILRIDPSLEGTGTDLAPADNPYADGTDGSGGAANPLIWARGVRNPWRISFDSATGDMWIADVGQNEVEEVSVLRAVDGRSPGSDLGWDRLEGNTDFGAVGPRDGWPDDDAPVIDPFFTYTHEEGCSISGGFVYRGGALPQLEGMYLLSDFCASEIRAVSQDGTGTSLGLAGASVVSINPDENGEPLVLDAEGIRRVAPV